MVGQSKKAYLHRPIRIQHFLTPATIQKCLTQLQNILAFLTINHLKAESGIKQGIFLHVMPVLSIVSKSSLCNRVTSVYHKAKIANFSVLSLILSLIKFIFLRVLFVIIILLFFRLCINNKFFYFEFIHVQIL